MKSISNQDEIQDARIQSPMFPWGKKINRMLVQGIREDHTVSVERIGIF